MKSGTSIGDDSPAQRSAAADTDAGTEGRPVGRAGIHVRGSHRSLPPRYAGTEVYRPATRGPRFTAPLRGDQGLPPRYAGTKRSLERKLDSTSQVSAIQRFLGKHTRGLCVNARQRGIGRSVDTAQDAFQLRTTQVAGCGCRRLPHAASTRSGTRRGPSQAAFLTQLTALRPVVRVGGITGRSSRTCRRDTYVRPGGSTP